MKLEARTSRLVLLASSSTGRESTTGAAEGCAGGEEVCDNGTDGEPVGVTLTVSDALSSCQATIALWVKEEEKSDSCCSRAKHAFRDMSKQRRPKARNR